MQFRLRTLLTLLAIIPRLVAIALWTGADDMAIGIIYSVTIFVIAVWLLSRFIILLNTRM